MDAERTYKGRYLEIYGQMRSRNTDSHVMLYILVTQDIGCSSAVGRGADDDNRINLCGYICKKGIMRKTSRGIVYNFIVAVNYSGRRTSYLPCIVWGDKAKEAEMLHIGDKISAKGRIQSRIYRRKEESREIDHITHEVCLNTFQKDSREADGNEKEC